MVFLFVCFNKCSCDNIPISKIELGLHRIYSREVFLPPLSIKYFSYWLYFYFLHTSLSNHYFNPKLFKLKWELFNIFYYDYKARSFKENVKVFCLKYTLIFLETLLIHHMAYFLQNLYCNCTLLDLILKKKTFF